MIIIHEYPDKQTTNSISIYIYIYTSISWLMSSDFDVQKQQLLASPNFFRLTFSRASSFILSLSFYNMSVVALRTSPTFGVQSLTARFGPQTLPNGNRMVLGSYRTSAQVQCNLSISNLSQCVP